jgi:uncharacterized protein (DUF169 family)
MPEYKEINKYGEEIEQRLRLKTSVIGVKLIEKEAEIPVDAVCPKKDMGVHLAQCQAFAMTRREGKTVAILKEDHWCWAPLVSYGLIDPAVIDPERGDVDPTMKEKLEFVKKLADDLPSFEPGKYIGLLSAPLKTARFTPDVIMIYSNNAQLRSMLMALKFMPNVEFAVETNLEPFDSCVWAIVPVFLHGKYRVTFPDPGEYERAMVGEDKVIFSMHVNKLGEFVEVLRHVDQKGEGYTGLVKQMKPDFKRPDFYDDIFKVAGLDKK